MLEATADATAQARATKLFIGGEQRGAKATFDDFNPADGSLYATAADADRADAEAAMEAAHAAFPSWAAKSHVERAAVLLKAADALEARRMDIVDALVREGGGWFGKAMFETGYVAGVFRAAAALAYSSLGEVLPSEHGKVSMSMRRPVGVVSVITPWNFPLLLSARGVAFALAAGNAIVLKPSEETPIAGGVVFAEIFEEAELPAGVLNVVTCSRDNVREVGGALVEHPLVKGISFTGSTAVGKTIGAKAGGLLKKCCLELGGKDALIIRADADLDRAVNAANFGSFMHQGQICMAVEKVLVHDAIADEFLARFVAKASELKVGDPSADKGHIIGPLINDRQAAKVAKQIEDAIAKGAKVELGGGVNGRYADPTILTNVTPDMAVYAEETFGPVAPVLTFSTDEQAIELANDTPYGLSAGVITADETRGLALAEQLHTGMCHINCSGLNDEPHIPFGGSKGSGGGRHGGRWSMETFTETRWITMERGGRNYPF